MELEGINFDAFSRLRVSNPTSLIDSQMQYDKLPLIWHELVANSGSATHNPLESSVTLATTTADASRIVRQTKKYIRYQPGKSQLLLCTFTLGDGYDNVTKRVGLFDDDNGVFLELTGDGLAFVVRSNLSGSPVDTRVTQQEWNLSELPNLNHTKAQILVIDLQWLGVGRVRFGFDLDGEIVYAHEFNHANVNASTYMTTANLPVRYEQVNTAAISSGVNDFKQICSTVVAEGGLEEKRGVPNTYVLPTTSAKSVANSASLTPVFSLRPKATFNSIANRISTKILEYGLINVAADQAHWQLILNPTTLTGATFAVSPDGVLDVDIAATAVAGGRVVASGFLGSTSFGGRGGTPIRPDLSHSLVELTRNVDNSDGDVLTLAARGLGGAGSLYASCTWKEDY